MPASSPTPRRGLPYAAALVSLLLAVPVALAQGTGWPRQFESTSGTLIVYQPQPEQLSGPMVTARAAFSLQKSGAAAATFGVLWYQAHVQIDRDSLTATQSDLDVTKVRLPGATDAEAKRYEHLVEAEATGWDLSGSLKELQAGLAASAKERLSVENLDHTPPRILFSTKRALLVLYDGDPQLEPIEGSNLQRVTNTPCAVVFDPSGPAYYLSGANLWYRASQPLGPWSVIDSPPANVDAVVPPDTTVADRVDGVPPVVITATEPTELVITDGEPLLEPLVGNELYYVANTESDLLRDVKTNTVYVLLSGRWYTARGLDDPWTYVPADQLPEIFSRIPADSPKGNLLASVSGTEEAEDAVADDQIPQTSTIARDFSGVAVAWDGEPQFEPIPGTTLAYGVNTDAEVIRADGRYYLCDQGVWYFADSPGGPWTVSDVRPNGLDDLAPDCPVYNLRYVEIYGSTPDAVEVGYMPGYLGYYPCRGTVVYGTGYRYHSWRGHHRYFPRPCTWGYHARYNPWLSRWSFGVSYWSGFLRIGLRWQQDAGHSQVRRTPAWFGPGGYHRPLLAMDRTMLRLPPVRSRPRVVDTSPVNIYTRTVNQGRVAKPGNRPSHPGQVGVGRKVPMPNNVFAGQDGRVYQRGNDGQWKVNQGGRWQPAPMPVVSPPPLVPAGGGNNGGVSGMRGDAQRPRPQPVPEPAQPATPGDRVSPGRQQAPLPVQPVSPSGQVEPTPRSERPSPRPAPVVKPSPQPAEPSPGQLERAFRARERAGNPTPKAAPAPRPAAPQKQEKSQERQQRKDERPRGR